MSGQSQPDLFTDLPRGEQLAALRQLKLDSYKHRGRSVSGAICKAVLRAIDDRAGNRGCFASQATIAEEVGCGVATVNRAIAALVAQDLITADKPNPWSPNTHRVNWTAVRIASEGLGTYGHRQEQLLPTANSALAYGQDGSCLRPEPYAPEARQIVPLIEKINAPTNRPAEWAAVVAEIFQWGMKSAATAVDSARERGLSVELVRELWLEGGGDREPKRWEPGQLSNWLTGKTDAPFDHDEALRRIAERASEADRREESAAELIRQRMLESGRMQRARPEVIAGLTCRKLRESGLERFATSNEIEAGHRLDDIDRARERPGPETFERSPDVGARSLRRTNAEPGERAAPSEALFRTIGIPSTRTNYRSRELGRNLRANG